jgi:hypothetical protein
LGNDVSHFLLDPLVVIPPIIALSHIIHTDQKQHDVWLQASDILFQ